MRAASLLITSAFVLGTGFGAAAQNADPRSNEQVCRARAEALNMTPDLLATYMRECLAGQRLVQSERPAK
ncbi:hypothetical protein GCM10007886_34640 [Methylobacterium gregans]|nr:hypothetical protein GCM10007886_34640 [Methylobacterium gregans]